MEYDFLRGRGQTRKSDRTVFLFAARPALDSGIISRSTEELNLFPLEYGDSSEFSFDDESLRDESVGTLKTLLESDGHTVRLLERVVEIDLDAEEENSLFEESVILH